MKTLYVSDLDGTLLNRSQRTSDFTNKTINALVSSSMIFSYATARSYYTSKKVTAGLSEELPIVMYNGTFILDGKTGDFLASNIFGNSFYPLFDDLISSNIYPIVYSFIGGEEKFSYIYNKWPIVK
ncbi:MAG: HAD family hydrolase [Clostridiales bacterium]|nr:HAD family hydrolase [Clostridiales bacterium]